MRKRRSFETGHRPKLMAVVDETPEADRALYYAAKRAARIGGGLVLINIIPLGETQVWLGVGDIMKAEAEEKSQKLLNAAAARVRSIAAIEPEIVMCEGVTAQEIMRLIEKDEDIISLTLAAGVGPEGPGPLVSTIAVRGGLGLPVPVTIVPGDLGDAEIDALA